MSDLITKYQYGGYASQLSALDIRNITLKDSSNLESLKKRAGWIVGLQLATMAQLQIHHGENMRALGEINNSLTQINESIITGFDSLENAIFRLEENLLMELSDIKWVLSSIDKKFDKLLTFIEFPRATEADELALQGTIFYSKNYFEEAEKCFSKAEKLNPVSFNLKINQGFLYLNKDKAEFAIENFQRALDFSDFIYHKKDIAEPDLIKSKIYAIECLARTFYTIERYEEAYKKMTEANFLRKSIDNVDKKSLYLAQVYNALAGQGELALKELINLARMDHTIYTQAILDPELIQIRTLLIERYETLLRERSEEVSNKILSIRQNYESVKNELSQQVKKKIESDFNTIEGIHKMGRYDKLNDLSVDLQKLATSINDYKGKIARYKILMKEINQINKEIREYENKEKVFRAKNTNDKEKMAYFSFVISDLNLRLEEKYDDKTSLEEVVSIMDAIGS